MQRTFHPKVVHYLPDGTGRDHFITTCNGGFTPGRVSNKFYSSSFFSRRNGNNSPSPRKEATSTTYRSNGSGRDSYIISNSGGLVHDFRGNSSDRMFKSTLRSSEESAFRKTSYIGNKDFSDSMSWCTP